MEAKGAIRPKNDKSSLMRSGLLSGLTVQNPVLGSWKVSRSL